MSIRSTGLSDHERREASGIGHNGGPPLQDEGVQPLVVKPKVAWKMLDCGNTHGYELIAAGELESFLDGKSRKITVESIRAYIARRLTAASVTANTKQEIVPPRRRRGRPPKRRDARTAL